MRYVPEEEDQMRRQDALVHTLPELQDRMHLHTGREEKAAAERVGRSDVSDYLGANGNSAKYIEGLENRLARMESLMRLSGVLPDDDDGSTDLATLEKRLADRSGQSTTPRNSTSEDRRASTVPRTGMSTADGTPVQPALPSPRSGTASPEPEKQTNGESKDEDALAEMMCSLVTNNCGETRYIGLLYLVFCVVFVLTHSDQVHRRVSPSSRPRVSSG